MAVIGATYHRDGCCSILEHMESLRKQEMELEGEVVTGPGFAGKGFNLEERGKVDLELGPFRLTVKRTSHAAGVPPTPEHVQPCLC
jgi:hypothetical protein